MANTIAVKRSVKEFIRQYESELLTGLLGDGGSKRIAHISTTRGQPTGETWIYIRIDIPTWSEFYDGSAVGSSVRYSVQTQTQAIIEYDVDLHIWDYAQMSGGEQPGGDYEPFEKDTETFETFIARIADLFRKYISITPEDGSDYTIEVKGVGSARDREIRGRDFSQRVTDSQAGVTSELLYHTLHFTLRTCGESRPLPRS